MSQSSPEGAPPPVLEAPATGPEVPDGTEGVPVDQLMRPDCLVRAARLHQRLARVRATLATGLMEGPDDEVVAGCRGLVALGLEGKEIADRLEELERQGR